ncbi:MAG: hypothetical protein KJO21_00090 [Verrucomicrobiae bacterium]|nr:hypothetical protein [Verrucomicrobiae bacterium]NNJ41933.1 hypothetical protein [Akkermansiaceae bacterium]
MGKSKEEKKPEPPKKGGCIKRLFFLLLFFLMVHAVIHIYFLWQPADEVDEISQMVIDANVAGLKVFPAIQGYQLDRIEGREELIRGESIAAPLLKARLATAIEQKYPVSFSEKDINAWLRKRLELKQGGLLSPFVELRGIWVDFEEDEVEVIIERELPGERLHVTSLFVKFTRSERGYSMQPYSAHVGQVRVPGGFARLIMSAFSNLLYELEDELQPYYDKKILDIHVEEGKVTLDPRRPEKR